MRISGDLGLRELANGTGAAGSKLVDLPSAVADVDTREELQAARSRSRSRY
jgi:CTP:molybdopterin cytidylyltransferase MocA